MLKKMRNRFILLNMVTITIVMTAAFAVIYLITYSQVRGEDREKLAALAAMPANVSFKVGDGTGPIGLFALNDIYGMPGSAQDSVYVSATPADASHSFRIYLDESGTLLDVSSYLDIPDEMYEEAAQTVWEQMKNGLMIQLDNRQWQYTVQSAVIPVIHSRIFVTDAANPGVIRVITQSVEAGNVHMVTFLDVTESNHTLTKLLFTFLAVGLTMLFILFGISYYFANRSLRPVAEAWSKQKQFITDASHELKTPLTIIGANSDVLLSHPEQTVDSQRKWVDSIQAETHRMGKLVNDLLYLAKTEDTTLPFHHQPFNLSETVNDAIISMETVVYEKGIALTQDVTPDIVFHGDGEKMKQVVLILLDNAAKYTDTGGSIDIKLEKSHAQAIFSIQNTGPGIPKDKLPHVFDRFYQLDPSRSQERNSYGLGLPIAQAIIERSGGSLKAKSGENEGATFTFTLKL